ncbi:TonB-dependent receptor plug domain-containing protein [Sulfidibacter corallicola]|uniref:TonB-dependent receptor n=1 Tax=Sulfidibacter corallicola TaxID=2818388 RepID=A0A8A4TQW4_SULCO|nr:TonB-dependent receptor [Sulfidibacter corallicola]QTD51482.1 TonB-dependent receptor [Sulfidibacter corallicola]
MSFGAFAVDLEEDMGDLMDLSLEELLNVTVVSASKKEENPFEAPLSVSVVTREEMNKAGATSWGEALRLLPGLVVREQSSGNYDIHVRGFDNVPPNSQLPFLANTLTLVMIDNRIVYNYFAGGTFWETLPVSLLEVDRIEVVRGPASPLYGPNAVAGVIHIITRKAEKDGFAFNANLEGGEDNTQLASLWAQYKAPTWSWLATANRTVRDRAESVYYSLVQGVIVDDALDLVVFDTGEPAPENPQRFPDQDLAQDNTAANIAFDFEPNEDWQFGVRLGFEDSEVQKAYFENGVTPLNTAVSETAYLDFTAKGKGFSAQVSYMDGDQEALGVNGWKWDFNTVDVVLEYDHEFNDRFTLRPGLSYRKATYDGVFIKGERDITTVAGSLRADYRPTDKWRLIGALRADQYDTPDTTELSAQVAISYTARENVHWRFSYGRSSRAPFMLDIFQDTAFSTPGGLLFELLGNENLDPLVTNSFEVGFRYKPNSSSQFEAEVFQATNENYSDVQLLFAGPDGEFFRTTGQFANLPVEPTLTGLTLSYSRSVGAKSYIRTYLTFTDTEIDDHILPPTETPGGGPGDGPPPDGPPPGPPPVVLVDLDEGATPEYYGGLIYDYTYKKWSFNLNLYAFDGHPLSNVIDSDQIESKVIANTKLMYRFAKSGEVYLNVRNLNDDDGNEFLFTDEIGRKILAGINLHF